MKDELLLAYKKYVSNQDTDLVGMIAFSKMIQQCYEANTLGKINDDVAAANNISSANQSIMEDAAKRCLSIYTANNIQVVLDKMYSRTLEDYKKTLDAYKKTQEEMSNSLEIHIKKGWIQPLIIGTIASLIASWICLGINNGIIKKGKIQEYEKKIEVLEKENQDLKNNKGTFYKMNN